MLTHSLSFRRRGVAVHGPRAEEAPAQGRDRVTDARGRGVEPGRLTVETQEASARCLLAAGPPTLRPTPGLAVARAAVARGGERCFFDYSRFACTTQCSCVSYRSCACAEITKNLKKTQEF